MGALSHNPNHHGPSSQVRRHGQAARRPAGLVAPIVHPHRHAHVRDLPGLRLPLLRQTVQDAAVGRLPARQGEPPVGVELDFHLPPAGAAVASVVHARPRRAWPSCRSPRTSSGTLVRSSLTTKRRTLTSTLSTRHATQPTVASPTSLAPSASTRTSSTRCWSSRTSQARTAR